MKSFRFRAAPANDPARPDPIEYAETHLSIYENGVYVFTVSRDVKLNELLERGIPLDNAAMLIVTAYCI